MLKGKRKSSTVHLAAALILTCYLAQTTDCYRVKKTESGEGQREADAARRTGVQEGRIVFGRAFEKGSGLESQGGTRRSSSNASVEDEATYQADFAGWPKGHAQDATSREALWKRMVPSLQCGSDQLRFRAVGPGASQFAVEQGNAPPVALSQVPSTCGYSMHRNSLALSMLVPYDGCNVVQEGGNYVLPMRWQGIPVSLWCPKPAAPEPPSHPQVAQIPQSHFFPPYLHYLQQPPGVTPTTTTTTTTKKAELPKYPPFYPPFYPYFPPPLPVTAAPTTTATTTTTTKKPEMPKFPQYPPFYPPFYPYFPPLLPVTAAPTTTKLATTTTVKPAATALPPPVPFPVYPPYYLPFPWPFPGPLPTTAKPTTKPPAPPPLPQFPPFGPFFPPFFPPLIPPHHHPTPKPETTTTTTSAPTTTTTVTAPLLATHFYPHAHFPFPFIPPHPYHHPPV